jgi:anti-anti-sigma factor
MEPGIAVVAISGRLVLGRELDHLAAAVQNLLDQQQKKIVFDISGMDYLDSAGIGTLVSCVTQIRKSGGTLRLAGANARVQKLFNMARVGDILSVYPTVAEAAAGIA